MKNRTGTMGVIASAVTLVVNAALLVGLWSLIPTRVITHWGFDGPDAWGSKMSLIVPALMPLVPLLFAWFLPRIDPKKENYARHSYAFTMTIVAVLVFVEGLYGVMILSELGVSVDVNSAMVCGLGLLWVVIGNVMPQIKPNLMFGIRTPWTIADEDVWRRTHRFSGKIWVASGLLMAVSNVLPGSLPVKVTLGILFGSGLISVVYSWWISSRKIT